MTIDKYIQIIANSYFWVFIVLVIIQSLYSFFSPEYKRKVAILEKFGKVEAGITLTNLFVWVLFIISIKLM